MKAKINPLKASTARRFSKAACAHRKIQAPARAEHNTRCGDGRLQLYVPILFGDAIDEIVAAHAVRFDAMWAYLRRILVFAAASGVTGWVMSLINNRMTYRVVQDIRAQSIRHIQRLPLAYLDRHSSGDIVSRIIADADILSDGLLLGFTQLFSGVVIIAVTLVFMFSKNVWITLRHPSHAAQLRRGQVHLYAFLQHVPPPE